jgi:hypothetical protein
MRKLLLLVGIALAVLFLRRRRPTEEGRWEPE